MEPTYIQMWQPNMFSLAEMTPELFPYSAEHMKEERGEFSISEMEWAGQETIFIIYHLYCLRTQRNVPGIVKKRL